MGKKVPLGEVGGGKVEVVDGLVKLMVPREMREAWIEKWKKRR